MAKSDMAAHKQADEFVSLAYYLGVVARHWLVIGILTVALTALAALYAFTAEPRYSVDVMLAPVDTGNSSALGGLASQAGPLAGMLGLGGLAQNSNSVEAIAAMQSKGFLYDFIERHGLIPALFPDDWSVERKAWKDDVADDPPDLSDAYEKMKKEVLSVGRDPETEFWVVKMLWHDAAEARGWLLQLVSDANESRRDSDRRVARAAIDYLTNKAGETSTLSVREAIFSIIEVHLRAETLANAREEYALKIVSAPVVPSVDHFDYPNRPMVLIFGFIAGLALGVLLAFVLESRVTGKSG